MNLSIGSFYITETPKNLTEYGSVRKELLGIFKSCRCKLSESKAKIILDGVA